MSERGHPVTKTSLGRACASSTAISCRENPPASASGPIVRGDVNTVAAHLADIAETAPATIPSYVAMAKATADRAVLDGRLLPIRAAKIVRLLDEALAEVELGAGPSAGVPRQQHRTERS